MAVVLIEIAIVGLAAAVLYARKGNVGTDLALLLTVGVIFGHPFFALDLGPLPITIPRLLVGFLTLRWLLTVFRSEALPPTWGATETGLAGFLVFVAIQLAMTNWSFNEKKPLSYFLFFLLLPAIVYFVASRTSFDERSIRRLRWALTAFGAYLAVTAIFETRGLEALVFPRFIVSPEFEEYLGRARGPFLNPVANGIAMTMGMLSAATFWPEVGRRGRFLIAGYVLLTLLGVYLTYTRSCWMGAALGLGFLILWQLPARPRYALIVIGLVVGLPVLIQLKEAASSFKRDKHVTVEQMEESASLRPLLAQAAWEILRDRPWTGVGYGQYLDHNRDYIERAITGRPLQRVSVYVQHNTVFALLAETGLIGTSLFLLFVIGSVVAALRLAFDRAIAWNLRCIAWIHLGTLSSTGFNSLWHDVLIEDGNFPMFTALAGVTAAVLRANRATIATEAPSRESLASLDPSRPDEVMIAMGSRSPAR